MKSEKIAVFAGAFAGLAMLAASPAVAQEVEAKPVIASYFSRGNCLDIAHPEEGAHLGVCRDGQTPDFKFVSGREGMISVGGDTCLTATQNGEPLVAHTCANLPTQQWRFETDGTLRNTLGQCADVERVDNEVGARVIAWMCHARVNQLWYPAITVKAVDRNAGGKTLPASGADIYVGSRKFSVDNVVAAGGATVVPDGEGRLVGNNGAYLVRGGSPDLLVNSRAAVIVFKDIRKHGASAMRPIVDVWAYFSTANGTKG